MMTDTLRILTPVLPRARRRRRAAPVTPGDRLACNVEPVRALADDRMKLRTEHDIVHEKIDARRQRHPAAIAGLPRQALARIGRLEHPAPGAPG